MLATGQLPDVFIWWPSDATAGLGSLRALHKTGVPVLKINQLPNEQDKQYIFGYAGPDDRLRARNAGYMMREAAAQEMQAHFMQALVRRGAARDHDVVHIRGHKVVQVGFGVATRRRDRPLGVHRASAGARDDEVGSAPELLIELQKCLFRRRQLLAGEVAV